MLVFRSIRGMERCLSPRLLRRILYPFATILALRDLIFGNYRKTPFHRLPSDWPSVSEGKRNLLQIRIRHHLSRAIANWPDRLGKHQWRSRFRINGKLPETTDGIILVSTHYGGMHLGSYFLRAHGYPVATFIGNTGRARSATRRAKDRLSHFPEMPHLFSEEDSIRDVCRFLAEGRILRMTFDVPTGRHLTVPTDGKLISFATGSIRLAAATGATLVPYVICERGPWEFVCELGKPVPQEIIHNSPEKAASHIVEECCRVFRSAPDQAEWTMLLAFSES